MASAPFEVGMGEDVWVDIVGKRAGPGGADLWSWPDGQVHPCKMAAGMAALLVPVAMGSSTA